jgi:tRNA pseudouridine55 synthase
MPLLINKPKGYTSHDIVQRVRKHFHIKRVGHAGTLDPLASGLLIILVGREETKLQDQFMVNDKEYIATIHFGQTSATDDAEGPLSPGKDPSHLTIEHIKNILPQFSGTITQRPPAYSAIHYQGQRLYQLARQGKIDSAMIPMRTVTITELELLSANLPQVTVRVRCSKGTYIRSLARDIGQALGVGAYLAELIRTRSGEFRLEDAITLEELKDTSPPSPSPN